MVGKRSGKWNGAEDELAAAAYSFLLRANATPMHGEPTADPEVIGAKRQACQCYLTVAGTTGVFAERLEIQALAEMLGCELSLFYYGGGNVTPNVKSTLCTPAETFDGRRFRRPAAASKVHRPQPPSGSRLLPYDAS